MTLGSTEVRMRECVGLWQRTVLVESDGALDTTTDVRWLQGITRFVDLRRPTPRPDFTGARCAADLSEAQRAWLRTQDGFAGTLTQQDDVFQWSRVIELQPAEPTPDAGRMSYADGLLVEVGVHAHYLERWALADLADTSAWAIEVATSAGDRGLLMQVGVQFGWACSGPTVELEISLGQVRGAQWIITDSARPYREGATLAPLLRSAVLHTEDEDAQGHPIGREWFVRESEGNVTL